MLWRNFIPISVGCAFVVAGGVAALAPRSASAAEAVLVCGENNGKLCHHVCTEECSGGGCCDEYFQYWPKES
jgi:hypothetical protein